MTSMYTLYYYPGNANLAPHTVLEAMAARPAVQRAFEQEGLKPPLY